MTVLPSANKLQQCRTATAQHTQGAMQLMSRMYKEKLKTRLEWLGKSYLPSQVRQDFTFHTRKLKLGGGRLGRGRRRGPEGKKFNRSMGNGLLLVEALARVDERKKTEENSGAIQRRLVSLRSQYLQYVRLCAVCNMEGRPCLVPGTYQRSLLSLHQSEDKGAGPLWMGSWGGGA